MKLPSKIYFIGMPGCGKSTLGKKVAELISCDFIDLDAEIEEAQGRSIPDIISQSGEDTFRQLERTMLKKISQSRKTFLMATGGGAPCFFDNMEWMIKTGISIYINTPLETIATQLSGDQKRPLIKSGKDEGKLLAELIELLEKRSPFYEQANITTVNNEPDQLVAELRRYAQGCP